MSEPKVNYGTVKSTKSLDDEGSTVTTVENIIKGKVNKPTRKLYEVKHRVHNKLEEQNAYHVFSEQIDKDKTMLDPHWKIEVPRLGKEHGYYYVVECFTRLEY